MPAPDLQNLWIYVPVFFFSICDRICGMDANYRYQRKGGGQGGNHGKEFCGADEEKE